MKKIRCTHFFDWGSVPERFHECVLREFAENGAHELSMPNGLAETMMTTPGKAVELRRRLEKTGVTMPDAHGLWSGLWDLGAKDTFMRAHIAAGHRLCLEIMADFGVTTAQFSAVALSFTLVTGIVGVAGGTLADKFGVRRVAVACGFITGAVSLLRLLVHSYAAFFAISLFMGAFLGCVNATSGKIIRAWFPERQTGLAFAVYAGIGAIGISLAQLMAPVYSGYRQALFVSGLILLGGAFLWLLLGRDAPRGAVLPPSQSFFRHLSRVVRLRNLWIVAGALACFNALIFSLSALLPTVFSTDLGLEVTAANRIAGMLNIAAILGMIVLPLAQARLGRYRPLLIALMLTTAALAASMRIA